MLLEYVKTAMFMWMFIEGLFLHNMVTGTRTRKLGHISYMELVKSTSYVIAKRTSLEKKN